MSYPTRYTAKGIDGSCWCRSCMRPGEDKGSFTQGFGYTSYHAQPKPVCLQNHLHGCPREKPEPEPENARCCFRPRYKKQGEAPVGWKTCETCGAEAPKGAALRLNALPTLSGVPCAHTNLKSEISQSLFPGWYECSDCLRRGIAAKETEPKWKWDHHPAPFEEPQYSSADQRAQMDIMLDHLGAK